MALEDALTRTMRTVRSVPYRTLSYLPLSLSLSLSTMQLLLLLEEAVAEDRAVNYLL